MTTRMPKPPLAECQDCNGTGRYEITRPDRQILAYQCNRCDGTGKVCSRCSQAERWCECPEKTP